MKIGNLIRNLMAASLAKTQPVQQALRLGDRLEGRVIEVGSNGQARIDFGAFRVKAEIRFPIQVGQRLPVEVSDTGAQLVLRLRGEGAATTSAADTGVILARLEVPKASELARLSEHIEQLLVQDGTGKTQRAEQGAATSLATEAQAAARAKPAAGQASTTAPALLSTKDEIVNAKAADGPRLPIALRQALETVSRHLQPVLANAQPEQVAAKLQSLVEDSGIFFEKRLGELLERLGTAQANASTPLQELAQLPAVRQLMQQDLKPNLLVAREGMLAQTHNPAEDGVATASYPQAQAPEDRVAAPIHHGLDRLLAGIEKQQQDACERLATPDLPVIFTWALPMASGQPQGQLKLYCQRKAGQSGNEPKRLSLLVDMSRLGPVRADLALEQRSLAVHFAVESENARKQIAQALEELQDALQSRFGALALSVAVDRQRLAAFGGQEATGPGSSGVNVRI